MKRFYQGTLYDSDNAELIDDYESDYPVNDFNYFKEGLYRTPEGKFFLYGKGNAASKYAERIEGNGPYADGVDLIPLSIEQAKKWYEENLERVYRDQDITGAYETYCKLFKD
ncbi:hypothetical protein [Lactobacillus crispatus]|uniref:Uncharacterized protein n=1 Tax=Lactobacillus crispatus TaxID=47770 RepID=A0AAW4DSW9_9LACO|nr:hypothetical protein [Lactobacillus crispatus]MBI1709046.1 hypothetical protein [Lactobacillus crispatus]